MQLRNLSRVRLAIAASTAGLALAASAIVPAAAATKTTTLTLLVDNGTNSSILWKAVIAGFQTKYPNIKVKLNTRPGGADGDNFVKTALATGSMNDVFAYNTGSLFLALNPAKTIMDVTKLPVQKTVQASFKQTVSFKNKVYGVPFDTAMGGGILYNRKVYAKLGLSVPKTWAQFMANNAKIKAADIAPVFQTFGDSWTSQILFLGDYYNVQAAYPKFAAQFTAGKIKLASNPATLAGFQHMEDLHKAGYYNSDYASAKLDDGIKAVATGTTGHYPMLTFALSTIQKNYPDNANDVGFFAVPGKTAAKNGMTVWTGLSLYINAKTKVADAAKKLVSFAASKTGTDIQTMALGQTGPYFTSTASAPAKDLPVGVRDMFAYFKAGKTAPALEFLSPVKGPNLEQILVSVGTGQTSAAAGAALYDEDVKKQALQLGLSGW